ncbi:carph-isopro domain-containing protein [Novosphingobium capsulatum]|uniref:carph-isopro domain-containing protein n=1 Tax=Novosphingobium capsulatum TaxID=13688 RepID=UPI0034E21753
MSIRNVISKLGGITAVARALGHRNVTTVQGWWDRELIPARRQRDVLDLAAHMGVPLLPDEIIPPASTAGSSLSTASALGGATA